MSNESMLTTEKTKEVTMEQKDYSSIRFDEMLGWLRDLCIRNDRDRKTHGIELYPDAEYVLAVMESLRLPEGAMQTAVYEDGNGNLLYDEMERVYTGEDKQSDLSLI